MEYNEGDEKAASVYRHYTRDRCIIMQEVQVIPMKIVNNIVEVQCASPPPGDDGKEKYLSTLGREKTISVQSRTIKESRKA